MTLALIAAALAGYVLGSIPFGLVLTRLAGLGDIRAIGSGNIGATNVLRTGRKGLAALTLLFDGLKGTAAVVVAPAIVIASARLLGVSDAMTTSPDAFGAAVFEAQLAGGFGAFLGHLYPVWLGFKGGKGVATYIGVLAGLFWPAAAVFALVWLATAAVLRYSSLSALLASVAAPIATLLLGHGEIAIPLVPLTALLIWRHHANIRRLMSGEEPKIGARI